MARLSREELMLKVEEYKNDYVKFILEQGNIRTVRGLAKFKLYDFQIDLIRKLEKNDFNIILKARQVGISTVVGAYVAIYAMFYPHSDILIVATNEDTAKEMILKAKTFFENLNPFFKPKIENPNNKESILLANGSRIIAGTSSSHGLRGRTASFLILDECVLYHTIVKLRNKSTLQVVEMPIGKLYDSLECKNNVHINNNLYEILSSNGWNDFDGVRKLSKKSYYRLLFSDNSILECSENHKIKLKDGIFIYCKDITLNDITSNGLSIIDKINITESVDMYDIIDVKNGNEYYTNNVVSHNCAFIKNIEELWTSVYPTLSTGGRSIILSTPNGENNFFHSMWTDAESGKNEFLPTKIYWYEVPGRDERWRDRTLSNMGNDERRFNQEYSCDFLSSSQSVVSLRKINNVIKINKENNRKPIENFLSKKGKLYPNLDIYEKPIPDDLYLISVDTSEGIGEDASAFVIINVSKNRIIGEFNDRYIGQKDLKNLLCDIGITFNTALIVLELRSTGGIVANYLIEDKYPNLFWCDRKIIQFFDENDIIKLPNQYDIKDNNMIPGIATNSKIKIMIVNEMRNIIEGDEIEIWTNRMLEQQKTFVQKATAGGLPKYGASGRNSDDLIIATAIGLYIKKYIWKIMENNNVLSEQVMKHFTRSTTDMTNNKLLSETMAMSPIYNAKALKKVTNPYKHSIFGDLRSALK